MNISINYTKEDLITIYKNKILLEWIATHHPETISKVELFLKNELND